MRAAIALRNVVGKALHALLVGVVPLHSDLGGDAVFFADRIEHRRVQRHLVAIHVFDKTLDSAGKREFFFLSITMIDQCNLYAVVQE